MKKKYFSPAMQVIELRHQALMQSTSPESFDDSIKIFDDVSVNDVYD